MTDPAPAGMSLEKIAQDKTDIILGVLYNLTEGPREAYGVLAVCLYRLNFEIIENKVSIDQLCDEITTTLRSITPKRKPN